MTASKCSAASSDPVATGVEAIVNRFDAVVARFDPSRRLAASGIQPVGIEIAPVGHALAHIFNAILANFAPLGDALLNRTVGAYLLTLNTLSLADWTSLDPLDPLCALRLARFGSLDAINPLGTHLTRCRSFGSGRRSLGALEIANGFGTSFHALRTDVLTRGLSVARALNALAIVWSTAMAAGSRAHGRGDRQRGDASSEEQLTHCKTPSEPTKRVERHRVPTAQRVVPSFGRRIVNGELQAYSDT